MSEPEINNLFEITVFLQNSGKYFLKQEFQVEQNFLSTIKYNEI